MQLDTKTESVLVHSKEGKPEAITVFNGKPTLYLLVEADRAGTERFYEADLQSGI